MDKVYKWTFRPTSQYLISNTAGTIVQVNPTGSSTTPINWGSLVAIPSASTILGTYDFGAGLSFNLGNLTTANSLLSRYDQYRLKYVTLTLDLLCGGAVSNSNLPGASLPGIFPTVYAFVDQDDATPPTNQTMVASRAGVKRLKFGQNGKMSCTIKLAPKPILAMGPAGTGGNGQGSNSTWIDSYNQTNPYFGLKLWFSDVLMDGHTEYGFRCNWTYHVEAKGAQNLF
jgi:hypothetical protein